VAITPFTYDPRLAGPFIRFGYDLYRGDGRWIPPFRDEMARQLSPSFPFYGQPDNAARHFLATAGGRVVGRVSAMVNADIRDEDGRVPGLLGFFECVEEDGVALDLIGSALSWLRDERGVGRVLGPMNFDIWHGYRFMIRGFDKEPFWGEPANKPYYPAFFESAGFIRRRRWHSVEFRGRGLIESLLSRGAERYETLKQRGYRFEGLDPRRFEDEMLRLHGLITASFAGFPYFTALPVGEFVRAFSRSRLALNPRLVLFVSDENDVPAGFAVALQELSEAVRAMRGRTGVVSRMKFLALRPRARRVNFYAGGVTPAEMAKQSGLGRAGFFHVLRQILDEGYEHVLVTLVSEDNSSNGFLGPLARDYGREYALYESTK
jgi:hypothetical protein